MTQFRYKGGSFGAEIDETRCRSSVGRGRASVTQCNSFPIKGTEWCRAHTELVVTDTAGEIWGVEPVRGDLKLVSVKILKETKKQIVLADRRSPFGYKGRIKKCDDGSLEFGFRTKLEAAQAWAEKKRRAVDSTQISLNNAVDASIEAVNLLEKLKREEEGQDE
jgi:hypothetical protein